MNSDALSRILLISGWTIGGLFACMMVAGIGFVAAVVKGERRDGQAHVVRKRELRVLVADDSFLFRQIIQEVLAERDIGKVDVSPGGEHALRLIDRSLEEDRPYGLIFLDLDMPKVSGLDVVVRLRQERRYDRSPVFMVSAATYSAMVIEVLNAGATGYVMKPVSAESLSARVNDALAMIQKGFEY